MRKESLILQDILDAISDKKNSPKKQPKKNS